jgi:hypothetical protein
MKKLAFVLVWDLSLASLVSGCGDPSGPMTNDLGSDFDPA